MLRCRCTPTHPAVHNNLPDPHPPATLMLKLSTKPYCVREGGSGVTPISGTRHGCTGAASEAAVTATAAQAYRPPLPNQARCWAQLAVHTQSDQVMGVRVA